MSQSDRLTYLKNKFILKEQTKLSPILSLTSYLQFKNYQLTNTIINSKPTLNNLSLTNTHFFYGIPVNPTNCTPFIECINTNQRPNRHTSTKLMFGRNLKYIKNKPSCALLHFCNRQKNPYNIIN